MKLASFFSGAGGLDRGFEASNFEVVWANEYDKAIWSTFERNFPHTVLDRRSITQISPEDVPDVDGMVGGPPCQSWSEAGALRGIEDKRGQLFFDYMEMIRVKRPKFFLAENVSGILAQRHEKAFQNILNGFAELGYNVTYSLLNANDYGVAQDRLRVIIVGYRTDIGKFFAPPPKLENKPVLRDIIDDLKESALPAAAGNKANSELALANHEYMTGGFSTMYMSRNRVRPWDRPSFTIQAGGRHAPIHPQAPEMVTFGPNDKRFVEGQEELYRRLSVRECARIQSFPDSHVFEYANVADGYKMVGNAVPINFAMHLASKIHSDLHGAVSTTPISELKPGKVVSLLEGIPEEIEAFCNV
jgi:DNA (cytosine-5)-methyltransferase 1